MFQLDGFTDWGLGMQLLDSERWSPSEQKTAGAISNSGPAAMDVAWGHLSQSGSAAFFLPGRQPRVLALLVNMIDTSNSQRISRAVLRLLEQHSKTDG
jgi:hypothetical protein